MEQSRTDVEAFEFFIQSTTQSVENYFLEMIQKFEMVGRKDLVSYLKQARDRTYRARQLYFYGLADIDKAFENLTEEERNTVIG